jgi:hypothetical protein
LRPGHPHHGDGARRQTGRQRKNGLFPRVHGLFAQRALKTQWNLRPHDNLDGCVGSIERVAAKSGFKQNTAAFMLQKSINLFRQTPAIE